MSEVTPEIIYLIPESDGNGIYHVWCDTPCPSDEHVESDAIKYVRADVQRDKAVINGLRQNKL